MARPKAKIDDPLMTVSEIAEMFKVTSYTVRVWLRRGDIKAIQVNTHWRARRSDVEAYANQKYGDGSEDS